ncbi:MAG: NAD(P)/FAD-dependent oxidoreductase [Microthrixaceae bacterium]
MTNGGETEPADVVVIGGGAAGLAVTAAIAKSGRRVLLLERCEAAGTAWIDRVPGLRLNTERRLSSVAGWIAPRSLGRWPTGNDYAGYLASVAAALARRPEVEFRFGARAGRIEQADDDSGSSHSRWLVHTDAEPLECAAVVVATGKDRIPHIPRLPGDDSTSIERVHAEALDGLGRFRGSRVLVVGAGNTGTELAHQLAAIARVDLAMRSRPLFVRRNVAGLPLTWIIMAVRWLPDRALDLMGPRFQRALFGDLTDLGLGPPDMSLSDIRHMGSGPVVDAGFIDAVRAGNITLQPALSAFDGDRAVFADGRRVAYDTVIMATGYRTGLGPMIGHLVALDDNERPIDPPRLAPGLYAMGFNQSLTAFLPDFDRQARRIAKELAER